MDWGCYEAWEITDSVWTKGVIDSGSTIGARAPSPRLSGHTLQTACH